MYLKRIAIENIWPISSLSLRENDLFDGEKPKIIVLAGQNGSGKTMFLSNIVDAFHLFWYQMFNDVLPQSWQSHSYFKTNGNSDVSIGKDYGFSYLCFEWKSSNPQETTEQGEQQAISTKKYEYLEKSWKLTFSDCQTKTGLINENGELSSDWTEIGNNKKTSLIEAKWDLNKDFLANTHCFFPVSRFEYPHWLNEWKKENRGESMKMEKRFTGPLWKELISETGLEKNKVWLLDVFLDCLVDVSPDANWQFQARDNLPNKNLLRQSRVNIETILSKILKEDVELRLNNRNNGLSRLKLVRKSDGIDILPSLDNLSTGQTILLNIFATIIRLSDKSNLNKSIVLSEIEWMVVIDEIDAHLHIDLQKNTLPELLSLFPKIQFIITSHSPFFFLWLSEKKECSAWFDYQIIKMPNGVVDNDIDGIEEVNVAYNLFVENFSEQKSEFERIKSEAEQLSKPVVYVEGTIDEKYIRKAKELWVSGSDILDAADLKSLGGEPQLKNHFKLVSAVIDKIPIHWKILYLFDCDVDITDADKSEKLFKRKMPLIEWNPLKKWIENLFEKDFLNRAIAENPAYIDIEKEATAIKSGNTISIPEKWTTNNDQKTNLSDWICQHWALNDFKCFEEIFAIIRLSLQPTTSIEPIMDNTNNTQEETTVSMED